MKPNRDPGPEAFDWLWTICAVVLLVALLTHCAAQVEALA